MEGNKNKIKPAEINLIIHEPIYTDNLTKEEIAELPEKVRSIIVADLPEDMRGSKNVALTLKFLPHFYYLFITFLLYTNMTTIH